MKATHEDIPKMLQMGEKFHSISTMPCQFDKEAFSNLLLGLMKTDESALFVSDNGMIGGVLAPAYIDPKWIQAIELFWWSEDRHGMRLFREFEKWAERKGANEVRMSSIRGVSNADGIYRAKGYTEKEISYSRVL